MRCRRSVLYFRHNAETAEWTGRHTLPWTRRYRTGRSASEALAYLCQWFSITWRLTSQLRESSSNTHLLNRSTFQPRSHMQLNLRGNASSLSRRRFPICRLGSSSMRTCHETPRRCFKTPVTTWKQFWMRVSAASPTAHYSTLAKGKNEYWSRSILISPTYVSTRLSTILGFGFCAQDRRALGMCLHFFAEGSTYMPANRRFGGSGSLSAVESEFASVVPGT